jgi:hypothetical protein
MNTVMSFRVPCYVQEIAEIQGDVAPFCRSRSFSGHIPRTGVWKFVPFSRYAGSHSHRALPFSHTGCPKKDDPWSAHSLSGSSPSPAGYHVWSTSGVS